MSEPLIRADLAELLAAEPCEFQGDPTLGRLLWLDVDGTTVRIYLPAVDAGRLLDRLIALELEDDEA